MYCMEATAAKVVPIVRPPLRIHGETTRHKLRLDQLCQHARWQLLQLTWYGAIVHLTVRQELYAAVCCTTIDSQTAVDAKLTAQGQQLYKAAPQTAPMRHRPTPEDHPPRLPFKVTPSVHLSRYLVSTPKTPSFPSIRHPVDVCMQSPHDNRGR